MTGACLDERTRTVLVASIGLFYFGEVILKCHASWLSEIDVA